MHSRPTSGIAEGFATANAVAESYRVATTHKVATSATLSSHPLGTPQRLGSQQRRSQDAKLPSCPFNKQKSGISCGNRTSGTAGDWPAVLANAAHSAKVSNAGKDVLRATQTDDRSTQGFGSEPLFVPPSVWGGSCGGRWVLRARICMSNEAEGADLSL